MNENKEIEEMAKDIYDMVPDLNYGSYDIFGYYRKMAEKHYEQGYRNCKDKVVLSEEEYQNDFSSQFNKGYEKGSKETAREIFNTIIKALEERKDRVKAFYGVNESVGVDIAIRTVKELAKQYEVREK